MEQYSQYISPAILEGTSIPVAENLRALAGWHGVSAI